MADRYGSARPGDVLDDMEATRAAADRLAAFFAAADRSPPERPARLRGGPAARTGHDLMSACDTQTRERYRTLLHFEHQFPREADHGFLIGPACQVLESVLDRLLIRPAEAVAEHLVAVLRQKRKDRDAADVLEKWAMHQRPTTMSTQVNVLLALRRGLEQQSAPVREFVAEHYHTPYAALVADKRFGACLDIIRQTFRNPACHGLVAFDAVAYGRFARAALAQDGFLPWDWWGPDPADPGPDAGVFHHHLAQSRQTAPDPARSRADAAAAVARLLALHSPSESRLALTLRPGPAAARVGLRSIALRPGPAATFRLGDPIRFYLEVSATCRIVLIDVGTTGAVTVIWPNARSRDNQVEGGRPRSVPDKGSTDFTLTLTGRPGLERVLGLAVRQPFDFPVLPDDDAGFRELTPDAIASLLAVLGRLSPADWAAAWCQFEVGA